MANLTLEQQNFLQNAERLSLGSSFQKQCIRQALVSGIKSSYRNREYTKVVLIELCHPIELTRENIELYLFVASVKVRQRRGTECISVAECLENHAGYPHIKRGHIERILYNIRNGLAPNRSLVALIGDEFLPVIDTEELLYDLLHFLDDEDVVRKWSKAIEAND